MILNLPLAIWFGILTFASLFVTLSLGIAMHHFRKNVFKYHRFFALITGTFAVIHIILDILWLSFGIVL